jgi:Mannosyl-glycoprotein endo-beta-N-acetylglucosaminidase
MSAKRSWPLTALAALSGVFAAVALAAAPANAAVTGIKATVKTDAAALHVRTGPSTKYPITKNVRNRSVIRLSCKVTGQTVNGKVRRTAQWDRLTTGGYVSHGFVLGGNSLRNCPPPRKPTPTIAIHLTGPTPGMTNPQFIAASVAPAQQGFREFKVPPSVAIAQAILESGWGRSGLSTNDKNFFGIKCFGGDPGTIAKACHTYGTYECEPSCLPTKASFRVYATSADSYQDHGRFLTVNPRYRPAFQYTTNADLFLYQIWKAGYATSPTYVTNVKALMRQYNLYQHDKVS